MELSKFKNELRARITDFAVTHHLIGMSETKSNAAKKKQAEEAYQKLENWIIGAHPEHQEINTFVDGSAPVVDNKDQQALDF